VLPLAGDYWISSIRVDGDSRPMMQLPAEHFRFISPGYFEAIHLPLAAGRTLRDDDWGKPYVLISESTSKTLWPGIDPVVRQFHLDEAEAPFTVIGVVRDARTITLAKPDPMMVYTPFWYRCDRTSSIALRVNQDTTAMADELRKTVWSVDSAASVPLVRSLSGIADDSVTSRRFEMNVLLLFALSALALAGLGVYGVVTYSVAQRQQEIGLRQALGASRSSIFQLVLREGLAPVLAGAIAGVAMSFGFSRAIGSLLFEVSPFNPVIAGSTILLLIAVGAVASFLPARRAASIDPMQALRTE
jgi:hypothetical protein